MTNFFIFVVFIFAAFGGGLAGRIATFCAIFEDPDCRGNSRNYTETSDVDMYSWSFTPNGVWTVWGEEYGTVMMYGYGNRCDTYSWGHGKVVWVEKLHPYDFDDPALFVSDNNFFGGTRYFLTPSEGVRVFERPLQIQSWGFTGNDSYILSSNTGMNPTRVCLQPDSETSSRGFGIAGGTRVQLVVQVMQRVSSCPRSMNVAPNSMNSKGFISELVKHDNNTMA